MPRTPCLHEYEAIHSASVQTVTGRTIVLPIVGDYICTKCTKLRSTIEIERPAFDPSAPRL